MLCTLGVLTAARYKKLKTFLTNVYAKNSDHAVDFQGMVADEWEGK